MKNTNFKKILISLSLFTVLIVIVLTSLRFLQKNTIEKAISLSDQVQLNEKKNLKKLSNNINLIYESNQLLNDIGNFPGSRYSEAQEQLSKNTSILEDINVNISKQVEQILLNTKNLNVNISLKLEEYNEKIANLKEGKTKLETEINLLNSLSKDILSSENKQKIEEAKNIINKINKKISISEQATKELKNAKKIALEAIEIAKNPPQSTTVWQKSADKWLEAINILSNISSDSYVYNEAGITLEQYQKNYDNIKKQLTNEEVGVQKMQTAKNMALEISNMTKQPPYSSNTWKNAQIKWQEVIKLLKSIPTGTTVSNEAQKKLSEYNKNYQIVTNNFNKQANEEKAVNNLTQAKTLATKAIELTKGEVSNENLKNAKNNWKQAINFLQAIPSNTNVSNEAKKKIPDYTKNYQSVSSKLEEKTASETVNKFIEEYIFNITKGNGGYDYFCNESYPSSFFAPRSATILQTNIYQGGQDGNVVIRLDSSNKGGMNITADWTLYMEKEAGKWCIKLISEN
jgi:hypothetical protein